MTTLYLIRGIPGSGKSTLASTFVKHDIATAYLEADMYFIDEDGNYKFDASKLKDAHAWCQLRTEQYLKAEHDVVVSNTSTTEKEVAVYQQIAKDAGAKFVSIVVESRHDGENIHGVPPEKVEQMRQRFSVKV